MEYSYFSKKRNLLSLNWQEDNLSQYIEIEKDNEIKESRSFIFSAFASEGYKTFYPDIGFTIEDNIKIYFEELKKIVSLGDISVEWIKYYYSPIDLSGSHNFDKKDILKRIVGIILLSESSSVYECKKIFNMFTLIPIDIRDIYSYIEYVNSVKRDYLLPLGLLKYNDYEISVFDEVYK